MSVELLGISYYIVSRNRNWHCAKPEVVSEPEVALKPEVG